jgi:hypothetical protein
MKTLVLRVVLAFVGVIGVTACGEGPLAPDLTADGPVVTAIQGLPASGRITLGESILLSIDTAEDVKSVVWIASRADVVRIAPTALVSPCGPRCAWVTGTAVGSVTIQADLLLSDGSCAKVGYAKICERTPGRGCRLVQAELTVVR